MLEWKKTSFNVSEIFNTFGSFKFIVRVTDDLNPWHIVDFAIDEFSIDFSSHIDLNERKCIEPLDDGWIILCDNMSFCVINSVGQITKRGKGNFIDLRGHNSGLYFITLEGGTTHKIYWNEEK